MSLLLTLATSLKFDDRTVVLALLYLHKFNKVIQDYDQDTITLACLSLSSKITERPRRLRDLLSSAWKILRPTDKDLTWPSALYDDLRSGVVTTELILLRVLKYDLLRPTAIDYIDLLSLIHAEDSVLSSATRYNIIIGMMNPRCLSFTMRTVACSAIIKSMAELRIIGDFRGKCKEDEEDINDCLSTLWTQV